MSFDVKIKSNEIVSPFLSSIENRKIKFDELKLDPRRAVRTKVSRLSEDIVACAEIILNYVDKLPEPGHPEVESTPLKNAFEKLCYVAAETFEAYEDLGQAFKFGKDAKRQFDKTIKSHRRDWGLICNAIKHDMNELVPVFTRHLESKRYLHCFSLMRPLGDDKCAINMSLHSGSEQMRSYTVALRQLISDVVKCDRAAAILWSTLPDTEDAPLSVPIVILSGLLDAMTRVSRTEPRAYKRQSSMYDGFTIHSDYVSFGRMQAEIESGDIAVTSLQRGDGVVVTFPILGSDGETFTDGSFRRSVG
ncbi:hypothetical protein IHQ71_01345 [Rhizobium sp. TH2]|uniref:hypothetical protein n=1 Tax=Rhizobium sp. TH2 TaxID=2775403 RepID=UPI002157E224|nr:hypothetical protein [Rhizobium sp. TH2]UVC09305.1 hypothetical protein IHQ71_01345 [Rhizobium sp. TH2]